MMPGFPGRAEEPPREPARVLPLAALDPATLHRARCVITSTLRALSGVLDQDGDRPERS